jgi:hypothetical protein
LSARKTEISRLWAKLNGTKETIQAIGDMWFGLQEAKHTMTAVGREVVVD